MKVLLFSILIDRVKEVLHPGFLFYSRIACLEGGTITTDALKGGYDMYNKLEE